MERLADALGDFDEAIQLDPEEPRFRQERALALLYHDPDVRPERALPDLEEAIRLRPDRDWYYEDRGYILFQQGRWREAAEDFTRPDFRRISRFCPHRGAERVVWIDLARRLEGRPDLGARAIREFLDWYLGESEGWLTNRPVEQKLETWPVPLARFLAGDVDEERLIAGCRTYFDPADPDPGGESEGVAHRIMECHFVLAARFLALGLPERAEMHLREADGLPARNPMSWFVKHRLGR